MFSCSKEDKQEYVEEQPRNTETQQKSETEPVKTDSVKKEKADDNVNYKRSEVPAAVISPLNAEEWMGKYVTVKGFVADVYQSDKVAYLNFIKKYPDNPFSGVIFARTFEEFGDLQEYSNKNVEITGRISTYRGKPQMILDKKSQIKIKN